MAIYAISDLHLSYSKPEKTMDAFGSKWENYQEKIDINWKNTVKNEDTVIIPGDISWGMTIDEAYEDFKYINSLPGTKIILKGNHDYYFSTAKKINDFLINNQFTTIKILNNNSYNVEGINICGTRLWGTTEDNTIDDAKIYKREIQRLMLSLNSIPDEYKNLPIIVATHYPPFRQEVKEVFKQYNVKKCIYGHLHGDGHCMVKEGNFDNVDYICVSGDYINFRLICLN